jgi:steroid delta-isomerase-like uncharacterized protein
MTDLAALAQGWFDDWNARNFDAIASRYTDNARYERSDGNSTGPAEIVQYLREISDAFPDEKATIQEIHVAKDVVTVQWLEDATHLATRKTMFGEIPATGKGFRNARIATVFRFESDKIAAHNEYYDLFSIMVQLGWLEFFAKAMGVAV